MGWARRGGAGDSTHPGSASFGGLPSGPASVCARDTEERPMTGGPRLTPHRASRPCAFSRGRALRGRRRGPPRAGSAYLDAVVPAVPSGDGARDSDEGEDGLAFGGPRRTRAGGRKGLRCASFEPRAVPIQSGDSGTTEGAGAAGAEEVAREKRSQDLPSLWRPGSGPAAAPGSERRGNAR